MKKEKVIACDNFWKGNRKKCSGKYCAKCMAHNYNEELDDFKMLKKWICYSCEKRCTCLRCKKKRSNLELGSTNDSRNKNGNPIILQINKKRKKNERMRNEENRNDQNSQKIKFSSKMEKKSKKMDDDDTNLDENQSINAQNFDEKSEISQQYQKNQNKNKNKQEKKEKKKEEEEEEEEEEESIENFIMVENHNDLVHLTNVSSYDAVHVYYDTSLNKIPQIYL